ncbi:extracellular serine-rich protein [Colletotrichum scovillei]|nr:extracellular serine-rich protein [Colletotrichum scovillei]KAF4775001.1 extracellular serine-rich protein [Colletotrichum scovillei]
MTAASSSSTTGTMTASRTKRLVGATHTVTAGLKGLTFDPDNLVAEVGDIIEWHFFPKNHSVAKSDTYDPCAPTSDGSFFFSGFDFVTPEGPADNVFQITIKDKQPIWYYCAQNAGQHCKNGMVGVINQPPVNDAFHLEKHKALAAQKNDSIIPPSQKGGVVSSRPNDITGITERRIISRGS